MLGMICIRACSRLAGCRTATRVRSVHSITGITAAQVMRVCVFVAKYPVIKCHLTVTVYKVSYDLLTSPLCVCVCLRLMKR